MITAPDEKQSAPSLLSGRFAVTGLIGLSHPRRARPLDMARELGDDDAGPFESASPPGTVSDTPSPARGVPPAGPAPVTESFAASEDDYVHDSVHDTVFADDDARPG